MKVSFFEISKKNELYDILIFWDAPVVPCYYEMDLHVEKAAGWLNEPNVYGVKSKHWLNNT